MIELRDYQVECVAAVKRAYARGVRRQLIQLPTGTGKTLVFATLIKLVVDGAPADQERDQ